MKRILVFNGSPHKDGHTMTVVNALLQKLGGEVEFVHTYNVLVKPCIDCKWCFQNKGCSIKDDMQDIYRKIDWANIILIASPLHFGTYSAKLMTVASRFQTYWASEFLRGDREKPAESKYGVNIMTSGTEWINMFLIAEGTAPFLLDSMQANWIGNIYATKTDKRPPLTCEKTVWQIDEMAERLNAIFK